MYKGLLIPTLLLIPWVTSSCATQRVIASPECPKPAPLPAYLLIPAPDPLLFRMCLNEILGQGSMPSCQQLKSWASATGTSKNANEP